MVRLRAALCIFLWAVSSPCLSIMACPPEPCKGSNSKHRSCDELADWVIDGEVVSTHGLDGKVVLSNVAIVKGTYPVADDGAIVYVGVPCWLSTRSLESYLGKRIRLYGRKHRGVVAFDPMTTVEARLAAERESKELKLELRQVSADCRIPGEKGPSNEVFFRRGKGFFNSDAYSEARTCFLNAQKEEKHSTYYKEACYYLGMMYEKGKGVDQDWAIARSWYSKAGL